MWGRYIDELLTMDRSGFWQTKRFFFHCNGNYSIYASTNEKGDVVERVQYDVFGRPDFQKPSGESVSRRDSKIGNPYLFQGRRWDPESKFYYYRNRYYDPGKGRFITRDPLGIWYDAMQYGNGYSSFSLSPIGKSDPFGYEVEHSIENCEIKLKLHITIHSSDLNSKELKKLAKKIEEGIEKYWVSRKTGTADWNVDGCNVSFDAEVDYASYFTSTWFRDNSINITSHKKHRSFVRGGNRGTWSEHDSKWVFAHEAGHLMCLDDRYTDTKSGSVPNPGWEGNIMGEYGGVVEHRNIENILDECGITCPCDCNVPGPTIGRTDVKDV